MTGKTDRSYYCSVKFKFLKIDLESKTTYNCHAAIPHPVDFNWLDHNPGQLFNTPTNVEERNMMLVNQRNLSCEQQCWPAEDRGAISPRITQRGQERTHITSLTRPEAIDLTIGSTCNLTCSYCCKEYSSAWRRDIVNNGEYPSVDKRYKVNNKDLILMKLSQPEVKQSAHYATLMNEVKLAAPYLKRLVITGGEPLLDNFLIPTLAELSLSNDTKVDLCTGLGVSQSRFLRLVPLLKQIPNLTVTISLETTCKFAEFNRYGVKWADVVDKIEYLKQEGINIAFQSVITNLTVFGFAEFYKKYSNYKITLSIAHQPKMMSVHIMDTKSKQQVQQDLEGLPKNIVDQIMQSMYTDPTEQERSNIREFLIEFVRRRADLNLNIFPKTFLNWLELNNVV